MLQQLRIYKIQEGKFDEFLRQWLAGVPAIRQTKGWKVQAWAVPERSELVWILSRDCTLVEWEEKEKEYYSSPERKSLSPDPAQYIVDGEQRWIEPLALPPSVISTAPFA
jgi:hypothetical protein